MGNLRSDSRGSVLVGLLRVMWRAIILGMLGALICHQAAHAETIAATQKTNGYKWTFLGKSTAVFPTMAAACSGQLAGTNPLIYMVFDGTSRCYAKRVSDNGVQGELTSVTNQTYYACPTGQNWTLSGTSCTRPDCLASETRQSDGTCKSNCVAGAASTAARYNGRFSSGVQDVAYGTLLPMPDTLCDGQCVGTPQSVSTCTAGTGAAGTPIKCTVNITLTGAACSGGNGVPPTPDPCYGQGKVTGYVNNVAVCTGTAPITYTGGKSNPGTGGTPGEGGKDTETTCDAEGKCTTTETTTAPDGTKTEETTQSDKGTFCQENPNSPICKFTSFTGSCDSVPACDGDAVQCAQAQQSYLTRCALTSDDKSMSELGTKVVNGNDPVKSPSDASQVSEINLPTSFDTTETYGASCPAPVSITLNGVTKSIAFDTYCQWAEILGRIGVALAMIGGAMICFGSVKG